MLNAFCTRIEGPEGLSEFGFVFPGKSLRRVPPVWTVCFKGWTLRLPSWNGGRMTHHAAHLKVAPNSQYWPLTTIVVILTYIGERIGFKLRLLRKHRSIKRSHKHFENSIIFLLLWDSYLKSIHIKAHSRFNIWLLFIAIID